MFEVIPAIDLLGGKVVRLTQGDYNQVDTYPMSPADYAKQFQAAGATRIHVVDLDGARDGRLINADAIRSIRNAVDCTIELGGGIRSVDSARLLIDLGINYIILGSLLVKHFAIAESIIHHFPNQVIAGIDAKNGKVATEGWLDVGSIDATELVKTLNKFPLAGVIYTDIAKDGTLSGPNLSQLHDVATVSVNPVIASGGIGDMRHVVQVRDLFPGRITGCIVGKAVLGGRIPLVTLFN